MRPDYCDRKKIKLKGLMQILSRSMHYSPALHIFQIPLCYKPWVMHRSGNYFYQSFQFYLLSVAVIRAHCLSSDYVYKIYLICLTHLLFIWSIQYSFQAPVPVIYISITFWFVFRVWYINLFSTFLHTTILVKIF